MKSFFINSFIATAGTSEIVEFTRHGKFVRTFSIDSDGSIEHIRDEEQRAISFVVDRHAPGTIDAVGLQYEGLLWMVWSAI